MFMISGGRLLPVPARRSIIDTPDMIGQLVFLVPPRLLTHRISRVRARLRGG